jgi:hypothetical protein
MHPTARFAVQPSGAKPEKGAHNRGRPPLIERLHAGPGAQEIKVFLLLFFQKKKILLFLKKRSKKTFVSGAAGAWVVQPGRRC